MGQGNLLRQHMVRQTDTLFLTRQEVEDALVRGEFKALGWTALIPLALRHLEEIA
jgi:hypothetical protein